MSRHSGDDRVSSRPPARRHCRQDGTRDRSILSGRSLCSAARSHQEREGIRHGRLRGQGKHALDAGVETTINYKTESVADRVKELTAGRGVDAIVDMDFSTTVQLLGNGGLGPHGTLVSYGSNAYGEIAVPYRALLWNSVSLRFFLVYDLTPHDRRAVVDGLSQLLAARPLLHTVGPRFRLDDVAAAHEAVEGGGVIGNVIVELI